jgi:16S rRNA G966 N2-methylase RsmD
MTIRYKRNDEIFTKTDVVKYLLDEVGFISRKDLSSITLLEPASGEGNFAVEIVTRLYKSSQIFGFNFIKALHSNIQFIELNKKNINKLQNNIKNLLIQWGYSSQILEERLFLSSNYLTINRLPKFDCIVGNPPYVRHELIDKSLKKKYREKFSTFKYRADLYIPFYEQSLNLLKDNGKLSFVSSNRWLYNQYGEALREKIAQKYYLKKLLNIERAQLFENQVIAYPTVVTIENREGTKTLYYESSDKEIDFNTILFIKKETPKNGAWQNLFVDYDLNDSSLKSIEEQGFKIGIGVATGADKIFIVKKSQNIDIESSRLMPLLKSNALKGENIEWDESYIINPYDKDELCNLEEYPKLKVYFQKHKEKLQQRHTAKKNPLKWYKTIDKIKSDLQTKPKLLLPDLAISKKLHIDKGEFYPHHNLYYITHNNIEKLETLASILMSDFVQQQLQQISIKMNGGVARFQAQTLRKLQIPNIKN